MTQRSDFHVDITLDEITLGGTLEVPTDATEIVVFAHSSGSSRRSSWQNDVAKVLRSRGVGTLVFDLLTVSEAQNQANRFNIDFLTRRLVGAVDWLRTHEVDRPPAIGLVGSSTAAAAALQTAAEVDDITAVVSHGGRVEMASDILAAVESPTLLIVDETDREMLERNRAAYEHLECRKEFYTIPGVGHRFDTGGSSSHRFDTGGSSSHPFDTGGSSSHPFDIDGELEAAVDMAVDWFVTELQ